MPWLITRLDRRVGSERRGALNSTHSIVLTFNFMISVQVIVLRHTTSPSPGSYLSSATICAFLRAIAPVCHTLRLAARSRGSLLFM